MTTLTIEIPDNERATVSAFIKKKGGNILNIDSEDDLTEAEFALLQESYKEALLIKKGVLKALPVSELWK
jgi:hypothetical protein